ncbi:hypothetical protein ACE1SV_07950 [Streptomyces sp. E-15]
MWKGPSNTAASARGRAAPHRRTAGPPDRRTAGPSDMVRLSLGPENPADVVVDLEQALERAAKEDR